MLRGIVAYLLVAFLGVIVSFSALSWFHPKQDALLLERNVQIRLQRAKNALTGGHGSVDDETRDNPARANQLFSHHRWADLEALLRSWASKDVYGALDWAYRLGRIEAIHLVLLEWSKSNADGAFDWCVRWEPTMFEEGRYYALLVSLGRTDIGIMALNRAGGSQGSAARTFFSAWSATDPSSVSSYLEELQAQDRKLWRIGAASYVGVMASGDIASAVSWVKTHGATNETEYLFRTIGDAVVESGKIDSLVEWANSATPSPEMAGIYAALGAGFAKTDAVVATDWMMKVQNSNARAMNLLTIIGISQTRPDLAIGLTEGLSNESARDYRIGLLVDKWSITDQSSAIAYVTNSTALSSEKKAQLLAKLSNK